MMMMMMMIPKTYSSGTDTLSWKSCEPVASNGAAVVLAYGSDGMIPPWSDMIMSHARALAGLGFTALIPDYTPRGGN